MSSIYLAETFGVDPTKTDNGPAMKAAITKARSDGGGTIIIKPGIYYVKGVIQLFSNISIQGSGIDITILRQADTASIPSSQGLIYADSREPNPISGIGVSDLTLDGQIAVNKFSEHVHLMSLNNVRDVMIERVNFLGFCGDGIYLGGGRFGVMQQHNLNVIIRGCNFDGVNYDNRNGISIIDGDNVLIINNYFTNSTQPGQPGAIDVEPNYDSNICRNIKIKNNKFVHTSGSGGAIGFVFNFENFKIQPSNFVITGNEIISSDKSSHNRDMGFFFKHAGDASSDRRHGLIFARNRFVQCLRGIRVMGLGDATFDNNHFDTIDQNLQFGVSPPIAGKCFNIQIKNNIFQNLCESFDKAFSICTVQYLLFENNIFIECGAIHGYGDDCNIFFASGSSSFVRIINNCFSSPNKNTKFTIKIHPSHTTIPETNRLSGNYALSLQTQFPADDCPDLSRKWVASVQSESTPGTCTYIRNTGQYIKSGRVVTFSIELSWNGHTGTGPLSVPMLPAEVPESDPNGPTYTPIGLSIDGFTLTAGNAPIAQFNHKEARIEIACFDAGKMIRQNTPKAGILRLHGSYLTAV